MPEYITRITEQLTERWNGFSTRSKIRIIAAGVVVIVLLVVLSYILSRPTMIKYASDLTPTQISQFQAALNEREITNKVSNDATAIYVDASRQSEVEIAADELDILSDSVMNYEKAFNNSLTATSDERRKKIELAFQDELETKIEALDMVRKAYLVINAADEDVSIFDETMKSSATLTLDLKGDISAQTIQGIVSNLDNGIHNLDPEDISIMDTTGRILYDGNSATDFTGNVSNQFEYSMTIEEYEKAKVRTALLATGQYDRAEVIMNLTIDFNSEEQYKVDYEGLDGGKTGIIVEQIIDESTGSSNEASGVPGTSSNDGTTDTFIDDGSSSESESKYSSTKYELDKVETRIIKSQGEVDRGSSNCTVVLNKYVKYYEESVEKAGDLADTTWDAYKQSIEAKDLEVMPVTDEVINLVKNASQMENVVVYITKEPIFIDKEVTELPITNYVSIGLMVLLIVALGFVIYRSTAPEEIEEVEPELSVEDMLATTKETQEMEEIEFDDKSDTRKQIEKFVDENPEAVALLLRNWLNEDWE